MSLRWEDVERMFGPEPMVAYDADAALANAEHRLAVDNGALRAIDERCDGLNCALRQTCRCAEWNFERWVSAAEKHREEQYQRWRERDREWSREWLGQWADGDAADVDHAGRRR